MEKLIINFTPTGMIPTKDMTPHVPVTINEIVEDVHRAYELGITMTHIHARDEQTGVPTYKKEVYAQLIEGIRKYAPDLVICTSLSGRNFNTLDKRSDVLSLEGDLKPDMGSLTLSSLNFNKVASMNAPSMIEDLASVMKSKGIVPELEVFDVGMINFGKYLVNKGIIQEPLYYNLLFGNIACAQTNLLHTGVMLNDTPKDALVSIAGIGNGQLMMNSLAIAIGKGVRVGLEDNIWYDADRTRLATNSALIERIHVIASANNREIMSPSEFRVKMKMEPGHGKYGRIYKD
ncbi:3-keto-5-aminohexanoate cleavage protein [Ichthyenterobacterium sp. W332]|uniref:3-keto-5-aminohexanoate cleavage protein n=1 Tax=Microcosmobacter mediterraneus TaxID=3075607 RepID=A0ABU2YLM3_9FLAO|nr:3-keto-5-aminohexanoate cleavage protein [Ichthyenterobacterium sp. W332]MDT0558737.1 3-keto-5-aminohexanoate cleavage protein [Ichthyenterobacterium sp. W332]